MSHPPRRRYPWQRKRLRALLIMLVPVAMLAAYVVYRAQTAEEVRAVIRALEGSGMPANADALLAWQAPVEAASNSSPLFTEALSKLKPATPEEAANLPVFSDTQYEANQPLPDEERRRMFALLARNGESLDLFHRAAKLSGSRYDLVLNGKWPELPQLAQFPEGGKLLAGQAVLAAELANIPQAGESLRSLLALGESLREVPLMQAQLERLYLLDRFEETLERVLNRAQLAPSDLEQLQERVRQVNLSEGLRRGLVGDRVLAITLLPELAQETFLQWTGVIDKNALVYFQIIDSALALMEQPPVQAAQEWQEINSRHNRRGAFLMRPEVYRAFSEWPRAAVHLATSQTALGIELHRAQHDVIPESLQAVREALAGLPPDPFRLDSSIQFQRSPEGYSVFSVGPGAEDPEGAPVRRRSRRNAIEAEDLVIRVFRSADN